MKQKFFSILLFMFACLSGYASARIYTDQKYYDGSKWQYHKIILINGGDAVCLYNEDTGKSMLFKVSISFLGTNYYTENKYRWSEEDVLNDCQEAWEKYLIECPEEVNYCHVGLSASYMAKQMAMKSRGMPQGNFEDSKVNTAPSRTRTAEEEKPYEFEIEVIGQKAFADCSTLEEVTLSESVKAIWGGAFMNCKNLTKVTLPESLEYIGPLAFANCTSLKSIKIPSSVKVIDLMAFYGCTSLESVEIPESVIYVGAATFQDCTSLGSAKVKASVDKVEMDLFKGCSSLKSIDLPNTVDYIDWCAFLDCSNLETVNGAENIDSINYYAFGNCSKLENIPVFNNLKEIKDRAFEGCTSLKKFTFPNTLEKIGDDAFQTCDLSECTFGDQMSLETIGEAAFISTKLKSFNIPNTVTSVGALTFANCYDLKTATLSSKMTSIGRRMFAECFSLESITIPASIKTIDQGAFDDCTSLGKIVSLISNPTQTVIETVTGYNVFPPATLYVPAGTRRTYLNTDGWKEFPVIREGDGTWPENAIVFADSKNESVCVNSFDTNDDGYLSYTEAAAVKVLYCSFPTSITSFEELGYFTGLEEIGENAFDGCQNLKSFVIPDGVTTIGSRAFRYCKGLTSLTIGKDVTTIGNGAFTSCKGLTEVVIPEGVTTIGEEVFWWCSNLASITIPSTVTSIGQYAFEECSSLTKVNISDIAAWCRLNLNEAWNNPLLYAHHLYLNGQEVTDLVIPEGVTSIGAGTFKRCDGLVSISIPSSVTAIGERAFYESNNVISIYSYIENPFVISNVFDIPMLYSQTTLYVPAGKYSAYKNTNEWRNFGKVKEMVSTVLGDANGDGVVNQKDIEAIADYIVTGNIENFIFNNANVNGDNVVNAADIVELITRISNQQKD